MHMRNVKIIIFECARSLDHYIYTLSTSSSCVKPSSAQQNAVSRIVYYINSNLTFSRICNILRTFLLIFGSS